MIFEKAQEIKDRIATAGRIHARIRNQGARETVWVDVAVHLAGARWLALDGLGCKKIAAPQFHTWSPTVLLTVALGGLTLVDRTGNSAFHSGMAATGKQVFLDRTYATGRGCC